MSVRKDITHQTFSKYKDFIINLQKYRQILQCM